MCVLMQAAALCAEGKMKGETFFMCSSPLLEEEEERRFLDALSTKTTKT